MGEKVDRADLIASSVPAVNLADPESFAGGAQVSAKYPGVTREYDLHSFFF